MSPKWVIRFDAENKIIITKYNEMWLNVTKCHEICHMFVWFK